MTNGSPNEVNDLLAVVRPSFGTVAFCADLYPAPARSTVQYSACDTNHKSAFHSTPENTSAIPLKIDFIFRAGFPHLMRTKEKWGCESYSNAAINLS